jgi:DNA polymerase-1
MRPARLPEPGSENCLFLIDLSGYVFRAYHAIAPLSSTKGEPTHAVLGTVNMLQKVVNERRPAMLAVAMDSRGPTFRHEIDTRYKATRPAPPPDLRQQMARCEQIVRAFNIPVYQENGLEADDLIAAVVKRALDDGVRVVIVSSDKDLMQLVREEDDRVVLWDSMRDKVYGAAEVVEKFGVPPNRVRDLMALTGDSSDNVPGVPGVGPKTAADLLLQFGSLDGVFAHLDQVPRPKLREALREHEPDARVSQKLVSLRADAPVAWDPATLRYGGADVEQLRKLFTELEFNRQLDLLKTEAPSKRTYVCVTDLPALDAIVGEAHARGVLAVASETTSPDPHAADLLGIALATAPGTGYYVPIGHRYLGCPKQLTWNDLSARLGPLLADAKIKKVAHDLKHEEIVFARRGAPLDGSIFDALLAAYLLDPEAPTGLRELARRELDVDVPSYEDAQAKQKTKEPFDSIQLDTATEYAAPRAELALSLAERLAPRLEHEGLNKLMDEVELPLSRVLATIEMHGVLVDVAELERLGTKVDADLRRLEGEAKGLLGHDFSVRSRDQLEKILFDELKLPVVKRTPKGGRSTDADVLEALAEKHALPAKILEYRELDKLKGTYIDALPRKVNPKTGRIHTSFGQATAATGRLASTDPNLQNIPIRTELGRLIRAAFVAPPGHLIVSADYSQIELRVLAHLAEDPELIDAFRTGEDVHARTAQLVFDVSKDAVTTEMRRRAKTINFGVIYGMGDSALAKQLDITRDDAARFIEAYFKKYAGVARFMQRTIEAARQGEAVRTLFGRRRFLPNLHSANRGLRMEAERVAKNTPIQGTAADILKVAMVKLAGAPVAPGGAMILTVHDELVFEVPAEHVSRAAERIKEEMEAAVKLSVPLVVDVGRGENWARAH